MALLEESTGDVCGVGGDGMSGRALPDGLPKLLHHTVSGVGSGVLLL